MAELLMREDTTVHLPPRDRNLNALRSMVETDDSLSHTGFQMASHEKVLFVRDGKVSTPLYSVTASGFPIEGIEFKHLDAQSILSLPNGEQFSSIDTLQSGNNISVKRVVGATKTSLENMLLHYINDAVKDSSGYQKPFDVMSDISAGLSRLNILDIQLLSDKPSVSHFFKNQDIDTLFSDRSQNSVNENNKRVELAQSNLMDDMRTDYLKLFQYLVDNNYSL